MLLIHSLFTCVINYLDDLLQVQIAAISAQGHSKRRLVGIFFSECGMWVLTVINRCLLFVGNKCKPKKLVTGKQYGVWNVAKFKKM